MLEENDTPQFALPFRFDRNGADVEVVAEDSETEVRSCVEVLLRTPVGFYDEAPELGGKPDVFEEGEADLNEIQGAISIWEPRADPIIEARPSWLDELVQNIGIESRVIDDGR